MPLVTATLLGTLGTVLLWVLAGVVSLVLLVVALPFHARAKGAVDGFSAEGQVRLSFAWIVLAVRITRERATLHLFGLRLWTFRPGRDDEDAPTPERDRKRKKKSRTSLRGLWGHRHTAWRLLGRVLRTLRLRIDVQGVVGLGDPADTASLFQALWALEGAIPAVRMDVAPDWLDETIQLEGEARARLWLAHLGGVLLAAYLKKDTRLLLRAAKAPGA
jgi:hypothetical protein